MVRTDENGKKKKSASSDGSKSKKEVEKPLKDKTADKKKGEPSSSMEAKSKPASRQPAGRSISQPKKTDDYLGDFDLPSSSDEEEPETNGHKPLYSNDNDEPKELRPKVEITTIVAAGSSQKTTW